MSPAYNSYEDWARAGEVTAVNGERRHTGAGDCHCH